MGNKHIQVNSGSRVIKYGKTNIVVRQDVEDMAIENTNKRGTVLLHNGKEKVAIVNCKSPKPKAKAKKGYGQTMSAILPVDSQEMADYRAGKYRTITEAFKAYSDRVAVVKSTVGFTTKDGKKVSFETKTKPSFKRFSSK